MNVQVVALILSALLAMASAGQKPKDAEVLEDSGKDDLKTASSYGYGYAVGYPGYHYGGWYPYHGYGYGHYYGYGNHKNNTYPSRRFC